MEMAKKLVIAMILLIALFEVSRAASLCNIDEEALMSCKPAAAKDSNIKPSNECCNALSGADLSCLCSYKDSPMLPVLGIDPKRALELPGECKLEPPKNC